MDLPQCNRECGAVIGSAGVDVREVRSTGPGLVSTQALVRSRGGSSLRRTEDLTREVLTETMGLIIVAVAARDAQGFFDH